MLVTSDLRLVVFDVDGTLIDSQHLILAAMACAFERIGHPTPAREIGARRSSGCRFPRRWRRLPRISPRMTLLRLAAHYRDSFVGQRETGGDAAHAPLYPGARAALGASCGRPATRCSASRPERRGAGLDHVLSTHGIERYSSPRQTADDHPSKPHPSMLRAALAETGCDASRAAMVGDTEFDIAMGRAAGMSDDRRRLGLSSARPARGRRGRHHHRQLRCARRGAGRAGEPGRMSLAPRRRFWRTASFAPEAGRVRGGARRAACCARPAGASAASCRPPHSPRRSRRNGMRSRIGSCPSGCPYPRRQLRDRPGGRASARR